MAVTAGAIAVGGGALMQYLGGQQQAGAAADAAKAQQFQSEKWLANSRENTFNSLQSLGNSVTPAQMMAFDQGLQTQERQVSRIESLAQSMNPSLVEAGKQFHDLLQGHSAPVLDNLKNQRNLQRSQLVDSLKQQYGSGAESSTAGQQALAQFDSQTSNILSGAQQSYMEQMGNISLNGSNLESQLGQASAQLGNMQQMDPMSLLAKNKSNAYNGANASIAAPMNAMMQTAGSGSVADIYGGQNNMGLGKNIATLGGALMGSGFNKPAPTQTTPVSWGNGSMSEWGKAQPQAATGGMPGKMAS